MKYSFIFLMLCFLTACVSPKTTPAVSGQAQPINTPEIIKELSHE